MDPAASASGTTPAARKPAIWRALHAVEDGLLVLALAGIVALPIGEAVLRLVNGIPGTLEDEQILPWLAQAIRSWQLPGGIPGGNAITQHLTLLISMFGGAVAARQARLLTITQGFAKARAPWGAIFEIVRAGVSAGITALLAWTGWVFMLSEHETGRVLGMGVPVWVPQLAIAAGFALVAVRLLLHAGRHWALRVVAAAVAAGLVAYILAVEPETMTPACVLLALLVAATVLGAPIFVLLGGAAVFLFWGSWNPLSVISLAHYSLATNPMIPSLPLFTLAGYFLAESGTGRRMMRLLRAFVGDMRAGPALVTVLACAFFTSLTGASGVTILALGGLLVPFLVEGRYSERNAIGLLAGSGSIGMLFAPCLPLILYAIVAEKVRIEAMFLAGILPGILLGAVTAAWGAWIRPPAPAGAPQWRFEGREALAACWEAKWEVLIPIVSLGGIFSGLATPVEAAAITALYAGAIELFVYRDLKWSALPGVMRECGLLIGGVLLILGVAQALTNYLVDAQVPSQLVDLVTAKVSSPLVFIALLTIVLLIVGCLMDVFSAIIVVVPLIAPLGTAFGLDPIHLGILFLANLGLGFLTPPVGMSLFLASYRFNKPMSEVLRASVAYFGLQFAAVLLISYWPALSLVVPRWFGY